MKSIDVQKKLNEIIRKEIPTEMLMRDCMYLAHGENNRFCKQTSQVSCYGCKFYEPNIRVKITKVIEYVARLEAKHEADIAQLKFIHEKEIRELMDSYERREDG